MGGSRLACLSGALATHSLLLASASSSLLLASASSSLLAGTSCLLIEELLAAGSLLLASVSSLLAGTSGLLNEELLAAGSLLQARASGLVLDETEAIVLVRPQFVDGPLPILVRAFCASTSPMKNGPSTWPRRQQSDSLLVFADGLLMPFFVAKRSTNVGGGVVAFIVVKQPLGGVWGRLQPFKLQPPGRIREVGQGQISRPGSTIWGG